jgi:hypothetical protein
LHTIRDEVDVCTHVVRFVSNRPRLTNICVLLIGLAFVPGSGQTWPALKAQSQTPSDGIRARQSGTTQRTYVVNARVRPLLLFWIGRDDVGGGRITWREAGSDHAIELLVGSDPARAPRQINRWGFIREEFTSEMTRVLGVMKESSEETLDEAEASIERERAGGGTFKAVRTTITGNRAVGGTMTIRTPSNLTYRQLDDLLTLIPDEPAVQRTIEVPAGTQHGFLIGMTVLIRESRTFCRSSGSAAVRTIPKVPYVYKQTLYDLSLVACDYTPELRTKQGSYFEIVKGKFQTRNRATGNVTHFQVAFGTSGEQNGRPVRIIFRPRWWLEFELLLDLSPAPAAIEKE